MLVTLVEAGASRVRVPIHLTNLLAQLLTDVQAAHLDRQVISNALATLLHGWLVNEPLGNGLMFASIPITNSASWLLGNIINVVLPQILVQQVQFLLLIALYQGEPGSERILLASDLYASHTFVHILL